MKEADAAEEARHPIGAVAERTGLTPEVLRVWERRYGVVDPQRTEGGQRLYTDGEVERLRLLRRATLGGRGIGGIARLPDDELARLVQGDDEARAERHREVVEETVGMPEAVSAAVALARELNAEGLEALLRRSVAVAGVPRFLESLAAPFLHRVGEAWHAGMLSPGQEHLATRVVQRVVMAVLSDLGAVGDAPVIVLASPSGDRHEMGALLAAAAAAAEGWRVIYLGADLPAVDIAEAAVASGARAVGISAVFVGDREALVRELVALRDQLPRSVPLLLGGRSAAALHPRLQSSGWVVLPDLEELRATLRAWGAAPGR